MYNFQKNKNKYKINQKILNPKLITIIIKKIFNSNSLSQIIDETNCLSEVSHKCKISVRKNEGAKGKTSNSELREIHPSHYKKICPIETSEGKNAGLIWSLTKDSRINQKGFIETPLYI